MTGYCVSGTVFCTLCMFSLSVLLTLNRIGITILFYREEGGLHEGNTQLIVGLYEDLGLLDPNLRLLYVLIVITMY